MKKSITFLAGLFLAISLNAADINITTADNLATAYTNAAAGDVIILGDGTYTVDATINLTKAITIKALNPLKATVVGTGFIFNTSAIGDVRIEGLVFDGTKAVDQVKQLYFTDINGAATISNVTIENCKIINYGNCLLRANRAEGVCADFKVNNCVFRNIGFSNAYPFFQMTKTRVNRLEFTNNTIADLANEYIQFYGTVAGNDNAVLLFKNNTFYNTVSNNGRRPFGGKSGKIYVQNNIFVKSPVHTVGEVGFDAAVTTVELTNNVINDFASGALLSHVGWLVNTGNLDVDPLFKDVASYDFTLPANSALITAKIGDPRWYGTPSGLKNTNASTLKVYPNPTTDKICFDNVKSRVEIINLLGKTVIDVANVNESNLKALSVGTYIVRATDADGTISMQKVSKK